jgi:hypothetical protein
MGFSDVAFFSFVPKLDTTSIVFWIKEATNNAGPSAMPNSAIL